MMGDDDFDQVIVYVGEFVLCVFDLFVVYVVILDGQGVCGIDVDYGDFFVYVVWLQIGCDVMFVFVQWLQQVCCYVEEWNVMIVWYYQLGLWQCIEKFFGLFELDVVCVLGEVV